MSRSYDRLSHIKAKRRLPAKTAVTMLERSINNFQCTTWGGVHSPRNGLRAAQLGAAAAGKLAARLTPTPGVVGSTTKARPAQRHNHRATARKKVTTGPISFPDRRSNSGDASTQRPNTPLFAPRKPNWGRGGAVSGKIAPISPLEPVARTPDTGTLEPRRIGKL